MDPPHSAKRRKLTSIDSEKSPPSSNSMDQKPVEISTQVSSISLLPPELLSAIIDFVPKTQWPSLELVNRSFRDAVYSSWQSMKEFDIDKDVLDIRHSSVKEFPLSDFSPFILAKLLHRSPMLTSIIGFPFITEKTRPEIQQIQFTNLKRIDFGPRGFKSVELVEFLTTSGSRDRLKEIISSTKYQTIHQNWPAIFTGESSESQASRLKLEKLSLKFEHEDVLFLDPRIIDLIDPSSLTVLILDKISAPTDYLLRLITNCNHIEQLQFSFMNGCQCENRPCVHFTSSKLILEAIPEMEYLDSLQIGLINNVLYFLVSRGPVDRPYLDIFEDMPILIDRLGRRGRLIELGLLHDYYCSDQVITKIGDHLSGLKSLEIFSQKSNPATLVKMIKKMVSLEKLTFSSDKHQIIIDYCPGLEDSLSFNYAITSEVLKAVATHLQNLRIFHLWWPAKIEDLSVLTRLEHLEELSISGAFCKEINWETAFGHRLRSLQLQNCRKEFVSTILQQVPGLRRFVFSGFWDLPDQVLHMIPTVCPRLRELCLSPSLGNTKEAVQTIINGCPELEQLKWR